MPRVLTHAGLVLIATLATLAGCAPSDRPPNVIVIMVDTLRADYLGAYGFEGDVSPNIDRLARESVQFDRCFAQAPWTAPSTASFITSLHPQNHCVGNGYGLFCEISEDELIWESLPDEADTLAEGFRDAGYDTAAFVGNWVVKTKFGFAQGFDEYVEPEGEEQHIASDDILFEGAQAWLDGRDDDERPFLLYLHLMDVHAPYRVTHEDIAALRGSPSLGEDREITENENERRPPHLGVRITWSSLAAQRQLLNWKTAYAAGVRGFDRKLGRFLDYLRRSGRFADSIVVLTSDHGEEFLEHGEWEHGKTYFNEALHVPLLIRAPDGAGNGRRVGSVVSSIDIMPTLLEWTGVEFEPDRLQGVDLRPLLDDGPSTGAMSFASALPEETASVAAQDERFKLILDLETGDRSLYALVDDPGELHDVAAERPDEADRMRAVIERHLERAGDYPTLRPTPTPLSEEDIDRLRSLGYVR